MIDSFRKLRDLLDERERRNALLLFALMLVMGLVEILGVASIMPFMAVLSKPELIQTNPYLSAVYKGLNFADRSEFLIFLAAMACIVVVGRIAGTALTGYATTRYSEMRSFTLTTRLLESYMRRPYSWFLSQHSAEMGKRVLSEVDQVIRGSLIPALNLVSQGATAVFLIALVLFVQPFAALAALVVLGGAYSLIYLNLRRYLSKIGEERFRANYQRHLTVHEALVGIKELKVGRLERAYLRRFSKAAYRFSRLKSLYSVVNEMPRHFLEALAIAGILSVVVVLLITQGDDVSRMFLVLVLYAFAALRLLPAIQKIYASLVSLRFSSAALRALHTDLKNIDNTVAPTAALPRTSSKPLQLRHVLELRNVTFTYPNAERPSLVNMSLSIPARSTIGFVGSTGAGKTTVVDVILGLLMPQKGDVVVDNERVTSENYHRWLQTIGYVPQHIFLADDTVASNIALGAPPDKVDMKAVEQAARMAELHDFVISELPQEYQTKIGERGVRLSGGQRQRIGIARALYNDPDVLILDEATSALDNVTERAVMDAMHNLSHRKTILIIAHRLTTVRACDQLFLLEHGRLKAHGAYDELLNADQEFRKMASQEFRRMAMKLELSPTVTIPDPS